MENIEELTLPKFKGWLEAKDKNEVVGKSAYADSCPIACYLHSCGYLTAEAWDDRIDINPVLKFITPRWAKDFIIKTDYESRFSYPVTAAAALAYLEELEEDIWQTEREILQ